jgi:hypothetical protein
MSTAIDTTKVTGRRQLHFNSLDDILADVERLAKCQEIRTLGNWSAGKALKHVGTIMHKSIDGFQTRPPWIIRFIVRVFFKGRFLNKPMSPGFKLPARAAAELIPGETTLPDGLACVREGIHRLKTDPKRAPSAVLGTLTEDEWTRLHCRHCELHLSFLIPVDG